MILQFMKFGLVGGVNTLTSLSIYYVLVFINLNYMVATIAGYLGSSIIGYMLNRNWVFRVSINTKNSLIRYYLIYGISFIINISCMYMWIDICHLSEYIAPILTLCVTVPFNYFFSKLWIFKDDNFHNGK